MLHCVEFFLDTYVPVVCISRFVLHSRSICDSLAEKNFLSSLS